VIISKTAISQDSKLNKDPKMAMYLLQKSAWKREQ
jgi:hypothetical protein